MHTQDYVKGTVSKIKCSILQIPFKASDDKGTDYYDVHNFRTCVSKFDFCQQHLIYYTFCLDAAIYFLSSELSADCNRVYKSEKVLVPLCTVDDL